MKARRFAFLPLMTLGCGLALTPAAAERSPQPMSDTFGVFSFPAENERAWQALADLGVGWVRLQFRMGEEGTQTYTRVLSEGYGLWLTLYPRDPENTADPGLLARSERGDFTPADSSRYQALVEETLAPLVKTLRAGGKNPGDWLVIQLGNKTLPSDVLPDQPSRFWHGTADEYLHTLALTYEAVKSVDPSIPVAMTSLSSEAMEAILAYEGGDAQYQPIAAWADIHLYHAVESIPDKVAWYRTRWDGPLAASEVGGPGNAVTEEYSEAIHAVDLQSRLNTALDAGVQRVFWTTLIGQPAFGERYNPMALITSEGRRRQAFAAYQEIIQSALNAVPIPHVDDTVYAALQRVDFTNDGFPDVLAWLLIPQGGDYITTAVFGFACQMSQFQTAFAFQLDSFERFTSYDGYHLLTVRDMNQDSTPEVVIYFKAGDQYTFWILPWGEGQMQALIEPQQDPISFSEVQYAQIQSSSLEARDINGDGLIEVIATRNDDFDDMWPHCVGNVDIWAWNGRYFSLDCSLP